ncbi:MAG: hypothetical protein ACTHM1_10075 [Solirubrobacteraceae bacterium]
MLRRSAILLTALALAPAPAQALAAPQDVASTHAFLVAGHIALQATVSKWSAVEAGIRRMDHKFARECAHVGEGAPQDEEEQKMSYEVAGALWASGYHTDAGIVRRFWAAVKPLRWGSPSITRRAHAFAHALLEMTKISVPDLCGDVRAWAATGYKSIPASTVRYDKHVEAIEVKLPSPKLIRPFVHGSDSALLNQDLKLYRRFEELEVGRGFDDWDNLLEILSLPQ